jgi:hypothetical protein
MGFLKMRAPDEIFRPLRAFWEANKDKTIEEWQTPTPYHNNWESSTTIIRVDNNTLEGGGQALQQSIAMAARDAMEVRLCKLLLLLLLICSPHRWKKTPHALVGTFF